MKHVLITLALSFMFATPIWWLNNRYHPFEEPTTRLVLGVIAAVGLVVLFLCRPRK